MNQEKSQKSNTTPSSDSWKETVKRVKELAKKNKGIDWGEKSLEALRKAKFD